MRRWLFLCGLVFCFVPALRVRADDATNQKYKPLIEAMRQWLAQEITDKGIPALSWALVEDQQLIWSEGHGFQDPVRKISATGDTVYRVGSVSKPITALLLMMLVEQGLIDLDAPVRTYLPDFQPKNTTGKEITLRQMVAHRSGLVRNSSMCRKPRPVTPTPPSPPSVCSSKKARRKRLPGSFSESCSIRLA
jgi:CubicO group peptidase (beta-lactamase class C family)